MSEQHNDGTNKIYEALKSQIEKKYRDFVSDEFIVFFKRQFGFGVETQVVTKDALNIMIELHGSDATIS